MRYSRTSTIDISVDNTITIEGCTKFSLQRKLTRGKLWGRAVKPQGRTRGRFDYALKMSLYTDEYNLLFDYLKRVAASAGTFSAAFNLSISLFEPELGTTLWQMIGCSIADDSEKIVEDQLYGSDLGVDIDIDVMEILKDGVSAGLENSPLGQIGAA
ncbi:MAG TPA: hypothetical protein VNF91_07605 [Candidatus Acidoferrum sp.]|nr:hypothetical protein [Candidatus Acidoferrum sp.]